MVVFVDSSLMKPEKRYSLSGLKKTFAELPQIRRLGIQYLKLERGHCLLQVGYSQEMVGNQDTGLIHGGIITTLLDTAGGSAAFSTVADGSSVATLDLRLDYLTQAKPGAAIMGLAECYHQTRNIVFVRGYAYHHSSKKPIANFVASYMVGSVGFNPDV